MFLPRKWSVKLYIRYYLPFISKVGNTLSNFYIWKHKHLQERYHLQFGILSRIKLYENLRQYIQNKFIFEKEMGYPNWTPSLKNMICLGFKGNSLDFAKNISELLEVVMGIKLHRIIHVVHINALGEVIKFQSLGIVIVAGRRIILNEGKFYRSSIDSFIGQYNIKYLEFYDEKGNIIPKTYFTDSNLSI